MELRHLRYFVSVVQQGSFTKAAEKMFTAQPSLSQQIKDLEEEVGVLLFDRSAKKIRLTDEGEAFYLMHRMRWKMPSSLSPLHVRSPTIKTTRFISAF